MVEYLTYLKSGAHLLKTYQQKGIYYDNSPEIFLESQTDITSNELGEAIKCRQYQNSNLLRNKVGLIFNVTLHDEIFQNFIKCISS